MASGFGRTTCSAHGAPRLAALARQADRLTVKLAKALCHYRRPISLDARVQRTMLSGFLLKVGMLTNRGFLSGKIGSVSYYMTRLTSIQMPLDGPGWASASPDGLGTGVQI